jgi:hypothetical protein
MDLLFRHVHGKENRDMEEVHTFHRMVTPNVNVRRVVMAHLRDTTKRDSMTTSMMADDEGLLEIMPNLDAKLSILPYKFGSTAIPHAPASGIVAACLETQVRIVHSCVSAIKINAK